MIEYRNNSCGYSALREVGHNSPSVQWLSSQEDSVKEEGSNFTVEKPDKHNLSQVIKVTINSGKSWCLLLTCDKSGFYLCDLPKMYNPNR